MTSHHSETNAFTDWCTAKRHEAWNLNPDWRSRFTDGSFVWVLRSRIDSPPPKPTRVAQPNYARLNLGSADEAEGMN